MKAVVCCLVVGSLVCAAQAGTITFEGSSAVSTFGESIEGVSDSWVSTNLVSEGFTISARTDSPTHTLNANSGEFGINSDISGEVASDFDVGEKMVLKFDKRVSLDLMDFNSFGAGDEFVIAVGSQPFFQITNDDLDNKTTDIIGLGEGLIVEKDIEVSFFSSAGSIGLDSMNITVIPEPTVLSLIGLFGIGGLVVRRMVR